MTTKRSPQKINEILNDLPYALRYLMQKNKAFKKKLFMQQLDLDDLQDQIDDLQTQNEELGERVDNLEKQNKSHRHWIN